MRLIDIAAAVLVVLGALNCGLAAVGAFRRFGNHSRISTDWSVPIAVD